jgi:VWFA-related protein
VGIRDGSFARGTTVTSALGRAVVLAVALCTTAAPGSQVQHPSFHAGVDVVSVDTSIKKGNSAVLGLTSDSFLLTDNRVPQSVEVAASATVPLDLTIVLDVSGSMGRAAVERSSALAKVIGDLLHPEDRLCMIAFGTHVREIRPLEAVTSEHAAPALIDSGSTSLNDGVIYALVTSPAAPDRRRLLIIFTDAFENTSVANGHAAEAVMIHADTVVHMVMPSLMTSFMTQATNQGLSRKAFVNAVAATGGQTYALSDGNQREAPTSAIAEAFRRILDDFRQSYVLYYTLRGVPHAGWHDLSVKVVAPGGDKYTVRTRKGYFGG